MELYKNRRLPFLAVFSFLVMISNSKSAFAVQDAIVRAKKAIIYTDKERTSPIGFIKRGRKIKVGEIPRAKGTVLPVVVSGRVCYIKIVDLYLRKDVERYGKTVKYRDKELMKKLKNDK